jgi:hypothetical protein
MQERMMTKKRKLLHASISISALVSIAKASDDIRQTQRGASNEDINTETNDEKIQDQLPLVSSKTIRPESDQFTDRRKDDRQGGGCHCTD